MGLKLKKLSKRQLLRSCLNIVILLAIFTIGLNVGNGRINLNIHRNRSLSKNLPNSLDYTSVNQVYNSLKDNYDGSLTQQQLQNGLKHGLAEATKDPYTEYFTPQEANSFNSELNNTFSGIGAQLGKDADGNLQVIAPVAGTPAVKAGLQAQDLITSINGVSTSGMSPDIAVTKIRGPSGTKVSLQIVRKHSQSLTLNIVRQNIVVPSVTTKIMPGNVGYLQISTFANDTANLAQKAAAQFKAAGVKGIVLDLRDDPGGELTAAESVSSLWLNQGQTILQQKRGSMVMETDNAQGGNELHGIPTVVLINSGSASASEITAGALHDQKDAYLIGQKSYGKGVVQQLVNFGDGSQLKVTIASWYRPNGQNINHKGITPDQTVKENSNPTPDNDAQLQAAQTYLTTSH